MASRYRDYNNWLLEFSRKADSIFPKRLFVLDRPISFSSCPPIEVMEILGFHPFCLWKQLKILRACQFHKPVHDRSWSCNLYTCAVLGCLYTHNSVCHRTLFLSIKLVVLSTRWQWRRRTMELQWWPWKKAYPSTYTSMKELYPFCQNTPSRSGNISWHQLMHLALL